MKASVLALTLATLVACGAGPPRTAPRSDRAPKARWLVIAPHPDDEVLIASGVLARAVMEGNPVGVVIMTNGDFDCVHDGLLRQGESIEGLARLGVPESAVRFLGYPDGGLSKLGRAPLRVRRRARDGTCELGDTTYGARGAGGADYHRARTGAPAPYTRDALVADLARAIDEIAPSDVAITHPQDTHPDHASTYVLFREAIDRVSRAPRVHRAIVHNGDCWPAGAEPKEPCPQTTIAPSLPMPPLSGRLRGYEARERLPVPAPLLVSDPTKNPKVLAIAAHRSQTRGTLESYLFGFARSDEAFFPETFEKRRTDGRTTKLSVRRGDGPATLSASSDVRYAVEIDPKGLEAVLVRRGADTRAILSRWPLPHDLFAEEQEETFELVVTPRAEERAVELHFRCRGALAGVAVDVSASPSDRRAP